VFCFHAETSLPVLPTQSLKVITTLRRFGGTDKA
jgi:hypothetical protein